MHAVIENGAVEIKVETKNIILQFVKAKRGIFLKSLQQEFSLEKLHIESTMANITYANSDTHGFIVLKGPRTKVSQVENEIKQMLQGYANIAIVLLANVFISIKTEALYIPGTAIGYKLKQVQEDVRQVKSDIEELHDAIVLSYLRQTSLLSFQFCSFYLPSLIWLMQWL